MDLQGIIHFVERFGSFGIIIFIVWAGIKYIPSFVQSMLEKIDKINERNNITQKEMQDKYMQSLERLTEKNTAELSKISENFQRSVDNSTNWHQKHSQDLAELKNFIIGKYEK